MKWRSRWAVLALLSAALCCNEPPPDADLLREIGFSFRGHADLLKRQDGVVVPLVTPDVENAAETVGVCLIAPAVTDTSQWMASLAFEGSGGWAGVPTNLATPTIRAGTTLCFETKVPVDLPDGPARICGSIEDRYDGASQSFPCLAFEYRRAPDPMRQQLLDRFFELIESGVSLEDKAAELERMSSKPEIARFPILQSRVRMTSAYFHRQHGTPESVDRAARYVEARPWWTGERGGSRWAAMLAYERGMLRLRAGDLTLAWQHLEEAGNGFAASGAHERISVAMKQAEILHRVGATLEGIEKLAPILENCQGADCTRSSWSAARNTLNWLRMHQPGIDDQELAQLEHNFTELAESGRQRETLETVNYRINAAFARAKRRLDPDVHLSLARQTITDAGADGSDRGQRLTQWMLAAALEFEIGQRDLNRARQLADQLDRAPSSPRLRAWAMQQIASLAFESGHIEDAARSSERGLMWLELSQIGKLDQRIPADRAGTMELFHLDAAIAVQSGRLDHAWGALQHADRFSRRHAASCGETQTHVADHEYQSLIDELSTLEAPTSRQGRQQRQLLVLDLKHRIQSLVRRIDACRPEHSDSVRHLDFRAFAGPNAIYLLERTPRGIRLHRKLPISRTRLAQQVSRLRNMLTDSTPVSRDQWLRAAQPLARALVPSTDSLGSIVRYGLHGELHDVPLSALPIPGSDRWLAEETLVLFRPPGADLPPLHRSPKQRRRILFAVDPQENLPHAADSIPLYRGLFPRGEVLAGEHVTTAALSIACRDTDALHFDGHAQYDPGFPALSSLHTADGAVVPGIWRGCAPNLEFVNLSACQSARSTKSAGRGDFGLAGVFAQHGARFVIGSRWDIPDRLAARFNNEFYRALAEQDASVPESYRRALKQLREDAPPSVWGRWVLLESS